MMATETYIKGMEYLVQVIQNLSLARDLDQVISITRHAARQLTGCDGATFVLREGNLCYYVDEEAVGPLWKGKRFPINSCISGWAMLNRETVVVQDIYQDARIPIDAYRPTFVKSLAMVPIRHDRPIGAIGNYWATNHAASSDQIRLLEALANSVSIAVENVQSLAAQKAAHHSLEQALKSRDEFISIASHELRTPLTAFKLNLQMADRVLKMQSDPAFTPKIKELAELPLRQMAGFEALVDRLLDVSRIRLGNIQLQLSATDLSELVTRVVEHFRPQLSYAGCVIHVHVPSGLKMDCDSVRIEQILSNLLSNIARHAPRTVVQVRVEQPDPSLVLLSVEDDGPGMDADTQARLFQRFQREGSWDHTGGLGLGLYVSKSLVDAHQGSLRVESQPGKGTKFIVQLPCKAQAPTS